MRKLAAFIMAGRMQAALVVVGFAAGAFMLPPLMLLSAAALALVTLRVGAGPGLAVGGIALAVVALLSQLTTGQPWSGLVIGLIQWMPVFVLALVLRYTVSLGLTLNVAVIAGLVALGMAHALMPDLRAFWSGLLDSLLRPALERTDMPAASIDEALNTATGIMIGGVIASVVVSSVLALLVARWWQALLYNPGGFRQEFVSLRLSRILAVAGTLVLVLGMARGSAPLGEAALVALSMFFLQGIAVIHNFAVRSANPLIWIVGLYGLMFIALPQVMMGLTGIGVVDTLTDLRSRLGKRKPGSGQGD